VEQLPEAESITVLGISETEKEDLLNDEPEA